MPRELDVKVSLGALTNQNRHMTAEEFQQIAHTIPVQAGIYKYYGEEGELLYVGKAKSLRKRVSSYFVKNHDNL